MNYGASCYSSLNTACHFLIYLIKWVSRKSSGVKTWLNKTKEVSQIQESHSLHSYDIMADLTMFYQNHESKKKRTKTFLPTSSKRLGPMFINPETVPRELYAKKQEQKKGLQQECPTFSPLGNEIKS